MVVAELLEHRGLLLDGALLGVVGVHAQGEEGIGRKRLLARGQGR